MTYFVAKDVRLLSGSDDMSATVCFDSEHPQAEVRIAFTRTEPDAADDERRRACSYEVQVLDPLTAKVLAFTEGEDYYVSEGGLTDHALGVIAPGYFDVQIANTMQLAGMVVGQNVSNNVVFNVYHNGDSSVGIPGESATVTINAGGFAQEDRADFLANARLELARAFSAIWDAKAYVQTPAEMRAEGGVSWLDGRVATSLAQGKELAALAMQASGLPPPVWGADKASITPWEYASVDVGGYRPISIGASAGGVVSIDGDPFTPKDRQLNVRLDRVQRSLGHGVDRVNGKLRSNDVQVPAMNHGAEVCGYVLAFPGASDAEAEELIETLKQGGNPVVRVRGPVAAMALEEAVAASGLKADDIEP